MTEERLGRRIFLLVGAAVVAVSGLVGFFVGANNADRVATVEVFGFLTLPTSPPTMAVYAMALSATLLCVLFVAVEAASRFDEGGRG